MQNIVDELIVQNDEQGLFVHMSLFYCNDLAKKNMLATAIVAASHPRIIKMLCAGVQIDPKLDDIFFLCAKHQNYDAFCVILRFAVIDEELIASAMSSGVLSSDDLMKWDLWDAKNPRNAMYAISDNDIPRLTHLVKNGCDLTYWCSYSLRYSLTKYKKENRAEFLEVCKMLMQNGASMKAVVYDKAFREKIDSKLSRWLMDCGTIEITLNEN